MIGEVEWLWGYADLFRETPTVTGIRGEKSVQEESLGGLKVGLYEQKLIGGKVEQRLG